MSRITTDNIFEDLGFDKQEAASLAVRATLMSQIIEYLRAHKLTQKEAASRFGVSQPRISDISTGKIERFTIDALVDMLSRIGFKVETKSTKRKATFTVIEGGNPTKNHNDHHDDDHDDYLKQA